MSNGGTTTPGARVVLLAQGGERAGLDCLSVSDPPAHLTVVSSPYEAAAEVLASPVRALAVDLYLLSERHLRLIRIARRQGAEVLGFGTPWPGMTAEQLSGVRLVGKGELPCVIEQVLAGASEPGATEPAPSEQEAPAKEEPARPVETRAAAQAEREVPVPDGDGLYEPESEVPAAHAAPPSDSLTNLLTPEELSALLEEES